MDHEPASARARAPRRLHRHLQPGLAWRSRACAPPPCPLAASIPSTSSARTASYASFARANGADGARRTVPPARRDGVGARLRRRRGLHDDVQRLRRVANGVWMIDRTTPSARSRAGTRAVRTSSAGRDSRSAPTARSSCCRGCGCAPASGGQSVRGFDCRARWLDAQT